MTLPGQQHTKPGLQMLSSCADNWLHVLVSLLVQKRRGAIHVLVAVSEILLLVPVDDGLALG